MKLFISMIMLFTLGNALACSDPFPPASTPEELAFQQNFMLEEYAKSDLVKSIIDNIQDTHGVSCDLEHARRSVDKTTATEKVIIVLLCNDGSRLKITSKGTSKNYKCPTFQFQTFSFNKLAEII